VLLTSNLLTVSGTSGGGGAALTVTLQASPATLPAGSLFTVTWQATGPTSPTDWLGLYRVGDPNTSYLAYRYATGATSGSVTFTAPSTPGTYEVRYLPQNGYEAVAASNAVTVQ
jgi:hypothetical protein